MGEKSGEGRDGRDEKGGERRREMRREEIREGRVEFRGGTKRAG